MATLNTLRTKGGFIVSIVIGVSLLAFLLGDLTSGNGGMLGGNKLRVGRIAGTPIDYMEYSQEVDYTTRIAQLLSGNDALPEQQAEQARGMAWDALITRYSYLPGFEKLGVAAGAAEQQDMVGGVYVSPVLQQFFSDPQTGLFNPEFLAGFMANKDNDPNSQMVWEYIKEQMLHQRLISKYIGLVSGGMMVTDLEVQRSLEAASQSFSARYVARSYQTIADSSITLTNSQIRDYYRDHKRQFEQGETRQVEYVLFDMEPSQQDYADAAEHIAVVADEFAAAGEAMAYAEANSQMRPDTRFMKASDIDPTFASTILGGGMYGPQLQGDTYVLARLGESHVWPDSIGARHILLPPTERALADSLLAELRGGRDFDRMSVLHSLDQQAPGGDLGRFAPEDMIPELTDALLARRVGERFIVESPVGLHIMELTYRAAPVTKYQVATLTYTVAPSPATESAVYAEASAFLAKASGSSAHFDAAVEASGGTLFKREARIANTDRNVSGLQNSLEMVRWAYNERKAGGVSPIMEVGDDFVIATLTDVRHAGIAPIEQAAQAIRTILIRQEKARQLAAGMQGGSSLDQIASTLGVSVDTARNVLSNGFYIDGAGAEPQLIGAICASKPGTLSKPVEGYTGVYLFEVTESTNVDNGATAESERVRLEAMNQNYAGYINQALLEESKVEDMRVKFF